MKNIIKQNIHMRKTINLLLFMFLSAFVSAQTMNVKGVVKDATTGELLPGVSILIKGTTVGVETDFDGLYVLSDVQKGAVLVFNYLGYKTKEVSVNATTLNVSLEQSTESLDEIVVIGYGTQSKKEVTGAVTVVGSAQIEDLKPTRIEQALQGQVAGVNITQNSGSPGASLTLELEGFQPMEILDL